MILQIESGIPMKHIQDFFLKEADTQSSNRVFNGNGWTVTLSDAPVRTMGRLCIPVTIITFEGPEAIVQKMVRDFRMAHLSAGG